MKQLVYLGVVLLGGVLGLFDYACFVVARYAGEEIE